MKIFETTQEFLLWRKSLTEAKLTLGFVPTMGALHAGHEGLLKKSKQENDLTVLSIFVNPTQFNQASDFEKYPKTWEQDLSIAKQNGVDVIFAPRDKNELYPDQYRYQLSEKEFSKELCGEFRPGHFDGVLTVVLKLFQIVRPKRAYFGEKDFQQLLLIKGMVDAFFLDIEIVPLETVREPTGLALSSRNVRLSVNEKELAPAFFRVMNQAEDLEDAKSALSRLGFEVEYLVDRETPYGLRRLGAVWLGKVRLIDNVKR